MGIEGFVQHYRKYPTIVTIFTFISLTNLSSLTFLSSNIAGLDVLSGNFDQKFLDDVRIRGLVTNLVEDIPQLILQYYVSRNTELTLVTLISMGTSIFMLVINILRKLLLYTMSNAAKKKVHSKMMNINEDDSIKELEEGDTSNASSSIIKVKSSDKSNSKSEAKYRTKNNERTSLEG